MFLRITSEKDFSPIKRSLKRVQGKREGLRNAFQWIKEDNA